MSVQRGVYEARDGSVRRNMGNMGGWGVGQDLTQAFPFHVAHAENIRSERLFDPEPWTLNPDFG